MIRGPRGSGRSVAALAAATSWVTGAAATQEDAVHAAVAAAGALRADAVEQVHERWLGLEASGRVARVGWARGVTVGDVVGRLRSAASAPLVRGLVLPAARGAWTVEELTDDTVTVIGTGGTRIRVSLELAQRAADVLGEEHLDELLAPGRALAVRFGLPESAFDDPAPLHAVAARLAEHGASRGPTGLVRTALVVDEAETDVADVLALLAPVLDAPATGLPPGGLVVVVQDGELFDGPVPAASRALVRVHETRAATQS